MRPVNTAHSAITTGFSNIFFSFRFVYKIKLLLFRGKEKKEKNAHDAFYTQGKKANSSPRFIRTVATIKQWISFKSRTGGSVYLLFRLKS